MKKLTIMLIVVVVGLVTLSFKETYAVSQLPWYVTKFHDGKVTCYVMRDSEYKFTSGGNTYGVSHSGISCVK